MESAGTDNVGCCCELWVLRGVELQNEPSSRSILNREAGRDALRLGRNDCPLCMTAWRSARRPLFQFIRAEPATIMPVYIPLAIRDLPDSVDTACGDRLTPARLTLTGFPEFVVEEVVDIA